MARQTMPPERGDTIEISFNSSQRCEFIKMITIPPREDLAFLKSICWQTADFYTLTPEQMLSRYENGWHYREIFGNLGAQEQEFIKTLAQAFGSWLRVEL